MRSDYSKMHPPSDKSTVVEAKIEEFNSPVNTLNGNLVTCCSNSNSQQQNGQQSNQLNTQQNGQQQNNQNINLNNTSNGSHSNKRRNRSNKAHQNHSSNDNATNLNSYQRQNSKFKSKSSRRNQRSNENSFNAHYNNFLPQQQPLHLSGQLKIGKQSSNDVKNDRQLDKMMIYKQSEGDKSFLDRILKDKQLLINKDSPNQIKQSFPMNNGVNNEKLQMNNADQMNHVNSINVDQIDNQKKMLANQIQANQIQANIIQQNKIQPTQFQLNQIQSQINQISQFNKLSRIDQYNLQNATKNLSPVDITSLNNRSLSNSTLNGSLNRSLNRSLNKSFNKSWNKAPHKSSNNSLNRSQSQQLPAKTGVLLHKSSSPAGTGQQQMINGFCMKPKDLMASSITKNGLINNPQLNPQLQVTNLNLLNCSTSGGMMNNMSSKLNQSLSTNSNSSVSTTLNNSLSTNHPKSNQLNTVMPLPNNAVEHNKLQLKEAQINNQIKLNNQLNERLNNQLIMEFKLHNQINNPLLNQLISNPIQATQLQAQQHQSNIIKQSTPVITSDQQLMAKKMNEISIKSDQKTDVKVTSKKKKRSENPFRNQIKLSDPPNNTQLNGQLNQFNNSISQLNVQQPNNIQMNNLNERFNSQPNLYESDHHHHHQSQPQYLTRQNSKSSNTIKSNKLENYNDFDKIPFNRRSSNYYNNYSNPFIKSKWQDKNQDKYYDKYYDKFDKYSDRDESLDNFPYKERDHWKRKGTFGNHSKVFNNDKKTSNSNNKSSVNLHHGATTEMKPKLVHSYHDIVSNQIWKFYILLRQKREAFDRKVELKGMLFDALRSKSDFADSQLDIVGSSMNGLGTLTSDVDMCLLLPEKYGDIDQNTQAVLILRLIKNIISQELNFIDNVRLIEAKVPILKFKDKLFNIEVDLNINNIVGISNTEMVKQYTRIDWRVKPLAITIKSWANFNQINNAYQKTVSSYTLILMLIHYLQVDCSPPILPCLNLHQMMEKRLNSKMKEDSVLLNGLPDFRSDNHQSLSELFIGFLDYYGNRFDYSSDVVSVRAGRIMKKEVAREYRSPKNTSTQWHFICVEEPFDRTNTARSVSDYESFKRVTNVFKDSYCRIKQTHNLVSVLNFEQIFGPKACLDNNLNITLNSTLNNTSFNKMNSLSEPAISKTMQSK